jgi:acyl carrier protein
VDLTVTLEQEFNIDISDAALEEWQTVGDVVKTVEELVDA